jgi:hypothetical protein
MKVIALLSLLGMVASSADPIRLADLATSPPWVAHLDTKNLEESKVGDFLAETAGFDRFLKLEKELSQHLGLDLKKVEGMTLCGSGEKWQDTTILVRGLFGPRAFASVPIEQGNEVPGFAPVLKGPEVLGQNIFLNEFDETKLIVGTSPQAVRDGLATAAAPAPDSWEALGFHTQVRDGLTSAIALIGLDLAQMGEELKFEAELTRAMKSAWIAIGEQDQNIELSFFIKSADLEGLAFISRKWTLFSSLLLAGEGSPLLVRQAVAGQKVAVHDDWLCITMTASPQRVSQFLQVMAPLFQSGPAKVSVPE